MNKRLSDITKIGALPAGASIEVRFLGTELDEFPLSEEEHRGRMSTWGTSSDTGLPDHQTFIMNGDRGWPHVGAIYLSDLFGLKAIVGQQILTTLMRYVGAVLWHMDNRDSVRFYHRHDEEFESRFRSLPEFELCMEWARRQLECVELVVRSKVGIEIYRGLSFAYGDGKDYESAYQIAVGSRTGSCE